MAFRSLIFTLLIVILGKERSVSKRKTLHDFLVCRPESLIPVNLGLMKPILELVLSEMWLKENPCAVGAGLHE